MNAHLKGPDHTDADAPPARSRLGLTLVEVIVALGILGSVILALGIFSARLAQATSSSRFRITASQLAADQIENVKGAPRYTAIETLYVGTVANIPNYSGYTRQTWVTRVGGGASDTTDYKIVTVQVTNPQMVGSVRKTTIIAPF